MLKDGSTIQETAETLGLSRQTVGMWWKRYREEGERGLVSRRKNSGSHKITTDAEDSAMVEVSII